MEAKVYSVDGNIVKTINLPESIFNIQINEYAVYEAVKEYLNNQRQGTAKTKTRGEVSGGGRKPWKQKGTGRARAGSNRSPVWVGGGIAFGPKPRDYYYRINKKVRSLAIKSALTMKAKDEKIFVLENVNLEEPKTKTFADLTKKMSIGTTKKKLFIAEKYVKNLYKSVRNIEGSYPVMAHEINTYFVMNSDFIIFTEDGLKRLQEVFDK